MKKILLLVALAISHLALFAQLTIRLTSVPTNTPPTDTIFIAGNFNNWNPGDRTKFLMRQNDGSYKITFTPSVTALEYKFTRNSWASVEGDAVGGERANRTLSYNGSIQSVDNQVLSWKDLLQNSTAAANVRIMSTSFLMPQFGRTRRIWIYLPPSYTDTTKRFPVMYMHDGQNLFDRATSFMGSAEWQVDETLNNLANAGDKGCIVVGIDNGGADRIGEYTPWKNARYGGGDGAKYAKFIVETLKPYIDANFRTKSDRNNTAIGGSSLGGLVSMFAAAEYQNVFSKGLIFSPSFWYNDSCFTQARLRGKQFSMRYYFMSGTNEDVDMVPQMQQMVSVLRGIGYTDEELKIVTKADGQHAEWFWAREFGDGYKWLFRETATGTDSQGSLDKKIKVFPNPTDSVLNIETAENLSFVNIEIYDILGRFMHIEPLLSSRSINVNYLKSGNYVLRLTRQNNVLATKSFIKK